MTEIITALKFGRDIEISKLLVFDAGYPLKNFVEENERQKIDSKKEKNKVKELFYKLLNNSIYGKFGMNKETSMIVGLYDINLDAEALKEYVINPARDNIGETENVWARKKGKLDFRIKNRNFALASAITAIARTVLYEGWKKLASMPGVKYLCYVDSDSYYFVVDKGFEFKEEFVIFSGNGIKIEAKPSDFTEYKEGYFIAPKNYGVKSLDGSVDIVIKGGRKSSELWEKIKSVREGAKKDWKLEDERMKQKVRIATALKGKFDAVQLGFVHRALSKKYNPFVTPKRELIFDDKGLWTGKTKRHVVDTSWEILEDYVQQSFVSSIIGRSSPLRTDYGPFKSFYENFVVEIIEQGGYELLYLNNKFDIFMFVKMSPEGTYPAKDPNVDHFSLEGYRGEKRNKKGDVKYLYSVFVQPLSIIDRVPGCELKVIRQIVHQYVIKFWKENREEYIRIDIMISISMPLKEPPFGWALTKMVYCCKRIDRLSEGEKYSSEAVSQAVARAYDLIIVMYRDQFAFQNDGENNPEFMLRLVFTLRGQDMKQTAVKALSLF